MNETWNPEEVAGRILYGMDSLYGNGYFGSLDWDNTSIPTQTYATSSNTTVSWTDLDPTAVTYTEQTIGTQTWN